MTIDTTDWHPSTLAIHQYWLELGGGANLPAWSDVDLQQLKAFLANLWLIEFAGAERRPRIRLVGTAIDAVADQQLGGKWVDQVWPDETLFAEFRAERLHRLTQECEPHWYKGDPLMITHPDVAMVELLCLPFASDGRLVDIVLVYSIYFDKAGN